MNSLTIFYDPRCGLCSRFRTWLESQARWIALEFIDYASLEAEKRLPGITAMKADQEIVVLSDQGHWWQGDAAWLTCLWTTKQYRSWSHRLATPAFRPILRKMVHLLSENRLTLSRFLRLSSDAELIDSINSEPAPSCPDGSCQLPT